jgi:hypothetical protein
MMDINLVKATFLSYTCTRNARWWPIFETYGIRLAEIKFGYPASYLP